MQGEAAVAPVAAVEAVVEDADDVSADQGKSFNQLCPYTCFYIELGYIIKSASKFEFHTIQ